MRLFLYLCMCVCVRACICVHISCIYIKIPDLTITLTHPSLVVPYSTACIDSACTYAHIHTYVHTHPTLPRVLVAHAHSPMRVHTLHELIFSHSHYHTHAHRGAWSSSLCNQLLHNSIVRCSQRARHATEPTNFVGNELGHLLLRFLNPCPTFICEQPFGGIFVGSNVCLDFVEALRCDDGRRHLCLANLDYLALGERVCGCFYTLGLAVDYKTLESPLSCW